MSDEASFDGERFMADARRDRACGQTRYADLQEVARSKMSVVYAARDTQLNRRVAIKTLPISASVETLRREAAALQRLQDDAIVRLYDVDDMGIVMEYVDGTTLDRYAGIRGNWRAIAELLRETARAVSVAHSQGVIHRDLKPQNIIVTPQGRPKILDFGIAKLLDGASPATRQGAPMGTPGFMAPEQVNNAAAADPRTDVYGLGAVLYHALTGRGPFEGADLGEVLSRDPVRPRRLSGDVPIELETIALMCLARDPADRYATARDVAADLGRWLAGEPLVSRPDSPGRRILRRLRRHPARAVAFAATCVAAVLVARLLLWSRPQSPGPAMEQVAALEMALAAMEAQFYVAGPDVFDRRADMERRLAPVEELLRAAGDTGDPRRWFAAGSARYYLGDDRAAEEALLKALAMRPMDEQCRWMLARIYLERSQDDMTTYAAIASAQRQRSAVWLDKARKILEPSSPATGTIEALIIRGYQALARDRVDEVRQLCEDGLARFADRMRAEEFHNLLGFAAEGQERVERYSRALERRPHYAWAFFMRGAESIRLGRPDQALDDCNRALRLRPRWADALSNRGAAETALAAEAWRRRDAAGTERLLRDAISSCDAAVRLDPRMAAARLCRANAQAFMANFLEKSRGDADETRRLRLMALEDCDVAADIDPEIPQTYVHRGQVRERLPDLTGAHEDYDRALRLEPRYLHALCRRGLARVLMRRPDDARSDLVRAIKHEARREEELLARAQLAAALEEFRAAVADYDTLVSMGAAGTQEVSERARLRLELGDGAGAMEDFNRTIEQLPNEPYAYVGRGVARTLMGDRQEALADFTRAIQLRPNYALAYYHRAVLRENEDPQAAHEDFSKAIECEGGNPQRYLNRAQVRSRLGDVQGAISDYTEAIVRDGNNCIAYFNRGALHIDRGAFAEAAADFEQAIKLGGLSGDQAEKARRCLKRAREQLGK